MTGINLWTDCCYEQWKVESGRKNRFTCITPAALMIFSQLRYSQHVFSVLTETLCVFQMAALENATGNVVFKFEPFVLHVLCQELQDAQLLHSVAIESGFKNSGITVGRGGKIMMAVRSAHCLEVPLTHMGKLMVSEEYIEFLVHVANQKMEENATRIDRFYKHLEAALEAAGGVSSSPSTDTGQVHAVYVRRRKRKTAREQDVLPSPEGHNEELEPGDDPEGSLDIFAGITL